MSLEDLGYLSVGSQMRRIYEKLQSEGDSIYKALHIEFKSSWFPIYYTLSKSTRALTVLELTDRISYSRITVKNVVRELQQIGYVEVFPNPADSRSKLIQLSAAGRHIEPELQAIWNTFYRELKQLFGESDFLDQLMAINQKIDTNPLKQSVLKTYYGYTVRKAREDEFERIGELLVEVYSALPGFPDRLEQPEYYEMLRTVGELTQNEKVDLLVAVSKQGVIAGAVVYFHDMSDYGSGGRATQEKNACGFRLLGVDPKVRGLGVGKLLTEYCMARGRESEANTLIIHSTKTMKTAWKMYENLGFERAHDLDFMQGNLPVFGFRLPL